MTGPKTLYVDIETSPIKAYCWGLWGENIGVNQIIEPTRMICVAWKFADGPMHFDAEWHHGGARRMLQHIWTALDEAEQVVHFNGQSFDVPHINREFLEAGLTPPSPYRQTDLFRSIKQNFRFPSNKLAYIAQELELNGGKLKTDFDLWARVLRGDKAARKEMESYAVRDVELLLELHSLTRPWLLAAPNAGLYGDDSGAYLCPACGSANVTKNGFAYTGAGKFQAYVCKDCGRHSRDAKRTNTTPLREANS